MCEKKLDEERRKKIKDEMRQTHVYPAKTVRKVITYGSSTGGGVTPSAGSSIIGTAIPCSETDGWSVSETDGWATSETDEVQTLPKGEVVSADKLDTLIEVVKYNLNADEVDDIIDIVLKFRKVIGVLRREGIVRMRG